MAKESLFNVLNNLVDFSRLDVLDLFSGTGSIALEFASRGCRSVTAMDIDARCVRYIKKVTGELGFGNIRVIRADVLKNLKRTGYHFDLIFADPPYNMTETETIPDLIFDNGWLNENAWLILEHPKGFDFARHSRFSQKRTYGKVNFSFFQNV